MKSPENEENRKLLLSLLRQQREFIPIFLSFVFCRAAVLFSPVLFIVEIDPYSFLCSDNRVRLPPAICAAGRETEMPLPASQAPKARRTRRKTK